MNDKDAILGRTSQQSKAAADEIERVNTHFNISIDAQMDNVHYLSAEADTGWRYSICIAELPPTAATREGGSMLVTVTSPWNAAFAFQRTGYLSQNYIDEHLSGWDHKRSAVDIRVLTLLVRAGLGREGE